VRGSAAGGLARSDTGVWAAAMAASACASSNAAKTIVILINPFVIP
jgi:hypothetical protein